MTTQQYREHLCDVILMVFRAEDAINENDPELKKNLKEKVISPQEYVEKIADEILAHTPEHLYR